tara:strand:- start:14 stop:220 length:207 start_codon:yes stop_codon:yes gene_type:complete
MAKVKYIAPGWVPKTQPSREKLGSFFIGKAPFEEDTTDITIPYQDNVKQPHLRGPLTVNTEWKKLIQD